MKNFLRYTLCILMILVIGACADNRAANIAGKIVAPASTNNMLKNSFSVRNVEGGSSLVFNTNGVGSNEFKISLQKTLEKYSLLATDESSAAWFIDVTMDPNTPIDLPWSDSFAEENIIYKVYERATSRQVFAKSIKTSAKIESHAIDILLKTKVEMGNTRINAYDNAVRENITQFMDALNSWQPN